MFSRASSARQGERNRASSVLSTDMGAASSGASVVLASAVKYAAFVSVNPSPWVNASEWPSASVTPTDAPSFRPPAPMWMSCEAKVSDE